MSSVLRFLKQTPSKTIFNENGNDVITYAAIQTAVAANNGSFLSESMVLFPTLANLTSALGAVTTESTSSDTAMLDMGARLFMGVEGGDSQLVVFGLVKLIQGSGADAGLVAYACMQDETSTINVGVARGAW
jgi:hypothetical protein